MRILSFLTVIAFALAVSSLAQDTPATTMPADPARVFITDSQSWSIEGQSGGAGGAFAGTMAGGARPQTAEIIKTFGERCPQVMVNNRQERADYIVVLDHEGGKGLLRHKNKVAVFARLSGDSVVSKSTLSLGGSVQEACEAINKNWAAHGSGMRAAITAQNNASATPPVAVVTQASQVALTGKMTVASVPDGADIEVDGSFVGNTPSDVQVSEGDHVVAVKKAGFKNWERKLKVSAGSNVHLSAGLEKAENP